LLAIESILLAVGFFLFIKTKNQKGEAISFDKSRNPLLFLYPVSGYLYQLYQRIYLKNKKSIQKASKEDEALLSLYVNENKEKIRREHAYQCISAMLAIFYIFVFFSFVLTVKERREGLTSYISAIERPQEGDGEQNITLWFETEDGVKAEIPFTVSERRLQGAELEAYYEAVYAYIKEMMLGENVSIYEVNQNLNLIKSMPDGNMTISWEIEPKDYIGSDGTLFYENVPESGADIVATATVTYFNEKRYYPFAIHIIPKAYTKEELQYKQIEEALAKSEEDSREDNIVHLPDTIGDAKVVFSLQKEEKAGVMFFLGVIGALFMKLAYEEKVKQGREKREEQLLLDYPEMVSKFTLLLNAGMTPVAAFERIGSDYKTSLFREQLLDLRKPKEGEKLLKKQGIEMKRTEKRVHYAYEEILYMLSEIRGGISEETAIEEFGRRCRLICYLRFSTIVVQNMKKGTKGIIPMLELEAKTAYESRKDFIRQMGERAGTKLLGPMMGMLILVMALIMVPAFLSFGI